MVDLTQHWRAYNPTQHLCGSDLQGVDHTVTIARIEIEQVGDERTNKPILYFAEAGYKGMICGSRVSQNIQRALGSGIVGDWIGKKIQIYGTEEKNFGQVKDVVRVRPFLPKVEEVAEEKPLLLIGKKMYYQICERIYNEEWTLEKAREFFTITPEIQSAIELEIKAREAAENA
jgi:hypothetical protein